MAHQGCPGPPGRSVRPQWYAFVGEASSLDLFYLIIAAAGRSHKHLFMGCYVVSCRKLRTMAVKTSGTSEGRECPASGSNM